jgi:hypothetical protein
VSTSGASCLLVGLNEGHLNHLFGVLLDGYMHTFPITGSTSMREDISAISKFMSFLRET